MVATAVIMKRGARWTGQISIFMFHLVDMIHIVHIVHAVPRIPPVHRGVLWKISENLEKNMCFLTFFDIFGQIVDFTVETLQIWPLGGLLEKRKQKKSKKNHKKIKNQKKS